MSAVLDKDIVATLTDEERAALNEGMTDSEKATLQRLADEAGDDDGDDDGDPDEVLDANGKPVLSADKAADKPAEDKGKAADAAAAAAGAPDTAPAAVPAEAAQAQPVVYKAALPDDFAQRETDLATRTNELREKFKAGDIGLEEFDEANAALMTERDELNRLKTKAEISQEMGAQTAEQAWRAEINALFTRSKAAGGPDYAADEAMRDDLDAFVKSLAAKEANADKPMSWFLDEAHKRVMSLHGLAPAAAPKASEKVDPAKEAAQRRKPPVDKVPQSLAHVPGGDGAEDVSGDEFTDLDGLSGLALEDAIARMTPAQRQKYVSLQ